MMPSPPEVSIFDLIDHHDLLIFDAYGVLVRSDGAIQGARQLIAHLNAHDIPYLVLTNDASRSIPVATAQYRSFGLDIDASRVITSSSLILSFVKRHALRGRPVLALGEGHALDYIEMSGACHVRPDPDTDFEALFLCELTTTTLHQDLEEILSALLARIERTGTLPHLVLPNPDLIYPRSADRYGLTAGSVAAMFEAILDQRYPSLRARFEILGKPHPLIFDEALSRHPDTPRSRVVMIGDQLATDIKGAHDSGLHAALVKTGLHTSQQWANSPFAPPTFILSALWPEAPSSTSVPG